MCSPRSWRRPVPPPSRRSRRPTCFARRATLGSEHQAAPKGHGLTVTLQHIENAKKRRFCMLC
eukprot:6250563-Lingulodinium_polyedra.AAC.1